MRSFFRGRLWLLGLGLGLLSGLLDTRFFVTLGVDFEVGGRDLTGWVAAYLAVSFAVLGALVGWSVDARARARRDSRTIREQMLALDVSRRVAAQNEKLAAIGRLAAGVAHEVRNPLGVIRASASMVQESFDHDSEPHRACDFICEEIDRLNNLIAALLTFARPAEPRLRMVCAEKIVDRALTLGAGELERRRIEVVRANDGGVPELVGDPDLLAQMLLGLVTNAAEALEEGGKIELRLDAADQAVHIDIADSGPGVAFEDFEKVFEPFYTTKDTGTGLGLAMIARIVESHGGRVQLLTGRGAGPEGRGACFRVELPLAGPPAGAVAA